MALLPGRVRAAMTRRRERRAIRLMRGVPDASFDAWQDAGWHVTPVHYYSPIPDTRALPDSLWDRASDLPGIDLRDPQQRLLLRILAEEYAGEYDALPRERGLGFYLWNGYFESVDAEVAYGLVRRLAPSRVVEIGSGYSTLLALRALDANGAGEIHAYEPHPPEFLSAESNPRLRVFPMPVQEVPIDVFAGLGENDILFIDSTHVGRIGSDVLVEVLEVLPRLAPGVFVHFHDIFLPGQYPRDWVMRDHRFWNEQYLLQAFLAHNAAFEVVWAGAHMHLRHSDLLRSAIASYDPERVRPGSFWMRRAR